MTTVYIWAHPRSRSTAMERAFMERGDCEVVHEPLSMVRYHDWDPAQIVDTLINTPIGQLEPPIDSITFNPASPQVRVVKDFPYHDPSATARIVRDDRAAEHIFLARDPQETVSSWLQVEPDFEEWELGYAELLESIHTYEEATGRQPHIVTAQALSMRPETVLRRVCHRIGLPWTQKMIDWDESTDLSSWHVWRRYHVTAAASSGIGPTTRKSPTLTGQLAQWASRAARPYTAIASYEER